MDMDDDLPSVEALQVPRRPPAELDVMNDPVFDAPKGKRKSVDEPDTCRICRGEGSKEEPLFYPCKCSGSIKFVHQNCLMEWLSHSQKKHCELCKTPFRFTKLYHPHMPNAVPLPVFLRQAAVHIWGKFVYTSRFQLVMFVWVVWLPWCMRTVFRGLFWIGDGGWINWQETERQADSVAQRSLAKLAAEGTTPAGPRFFASRDAAASAMISHVANALPQVFSPVSHAVDSTNGEPIMLRLARRFFHGMISRNTSGTLPASSVGSRTSTMVLPGRTNSSSWLSELRFLKSLTRSPTLNNIVIDTLEGQLITLLLVVAFILVFLIREWVVQQQPGMNMAAGVEEDAAAAQEEVPMLQQLARQHAEQQLQRAGRALEPEGGQNEDVVPPEPIRRARMIARPRPRRQLRLLPDEDREDIDLQDTDDVLPPEVEVTDPVNPNFGLTPTLEDVEADNISETGSSISQQRPSMPTRDTWERATEIRRTLEEQSPASGHKEWPGSKVFMELWKRAESKPSEVLRIIDEEGRNDELGWIVEAMKRLEDPSYVYGQPSPTVHAPESTSPLLIDDDQTDEGNGVRETIELGEALPHEDSYQVLGSSDTEDAGHSDEVLSLVTETNRRDFGKSATQNDSPSITPSSSDHVNRESNEEHNPGSSNLELSTRSTYERSPNQSKSVLFASNSTSDPLDQSNNPFHQEYSEENASPNTDVLDASTEDVERFESDEIIDQMRDEERLNGERDISASPPQNQGRQDGPHQGLVDKIMDWLWGNAPAPTERTEQPEADDEHIVDDLAEEAPFVPIVHGQPVGEDQNNEDNPVQDPEVVAAAIQAGLDPNEAEAVDDIEDLEGIMELVGMQGPLAGLIQNGMFCAVLVSLTILAGLWIPYIAGKLFLVFLANPVSLLIKLPLRWASMSADLIIDMCVFSAGLAFYWVDTVVRLLCIPIGWLVPFLGKLNENQILAETAKSYAGSALERLADTFIETGGSLSESDIPTFSIIAHESLGVIEQRFVEAAETVRDASIAFTTFRPFKFISHSRVLGVGISIYTKIFINFCVAKSREFLAIAPSILRINPLRVSLNIPRRTRPLDYSLAYWDTKDRILAIVFGYLFFSLLGVLYLKISAIIGGTKRDGKVRGPFADILYQAGGVMKVILIISIEMIVFPLYCGLLLDVALLPLFDKVTVMSRINFTLTSPNTSLFVHWFVGTCYMFHFALFVSMCRKIMRSGVLYFIRDPDDPTFHPVRDVLERSVSTQLRKIAFSALVYGALVILCLGGVVWGIHFSLEHVFPIHWSSNEPVLEFPVDLLFYNFLMPLAVKFFKPSTGLNRMYSWWFRKCARALRLSHFLFGERREDEEGRNVRRTWGGLVPRKHGEKQVSMNNGNQQIEVLFVRDGRYVRAPASDQVRIPKGSQTFLEVDEVNDRVDGQPDPDQGLHGQKNDMFSKVYIPPFFRLRIGFFIFLIWLFAATTGVCITIVPLALGRLVFAYLIPNHLRMNDVYAFSIGIYLLGGIFYTALHHRNILAFLRIALSPSPNSTTIALLRKFTLYTLHLLRLVYTYFSFGFLLPSLCSLVIEFYIIIPLHTYFGAANERHIIHFIQDWTLGVLYTKVAGRLILWNTTSRPAIALRGIVRNGWLDPDVRLATRSCILPAFILMAFSLLTPLSLGYLANTVLFASSDAAFQSRVYRYSYPAVLGVVVLGLIGWVLGKAFKGWRQKIRDEVYLIGERLHNFGERRGVKGAGVGGKRVAGRG